MRLRVNAPFTFYADSFSARRAQGIFDRRAAGAGAGRRVARRRGGAVRRARRAQRMRENDAAESRGGDGFSDVGERAARWRGNVVAERCGADEAAAREGRIFFSIFSVA